jgi:hypothetical protein
MRTCTSAMLALTVAAFLPAQDRSKAAPAPAKTEYQKLVAEFDAAMASYNAARKELTQSDDYKKAVADKDRAKMAELTQKVPAPKVADFADRALKAADGVTGEDRVPFLVWAANIGASPEVTNRVVDDLLAKHTTSAHLMPLLEGRALFNAKIDVEKAETLLSTIAEKNANKEVKAWALYASARRIQSNRNASDSDKERAAKLTADAEKLVPGTELADRIAAPRFQAERLQMGMEVPEIVGEDMDGTKFKLSDYRGKVVVIDFWGFW